MASEEYLEANQETVQKFVEATQEIIDYINENPDDTADIIYEQTGMEQDVFINTLNGYELDTAFDQDVYDGLYEINDWAYKNGYYTNEYKIEDYINTDALKAAFPDKASWTAK
jgi:NitT/TauT family transport system substrate-binding protein